MKNFFVKRAALVDEVSAKCADIYIGHTVRRTTKVKREARLSNLLFLPSLLLDIIHHLVIRIFLT
jgi:hypothetical protein